MVALHNFFTIYTNAFSRLYSLMRYKDTFSADEITGIFLDSQIIANIFDGDVALASLPSMCLLWALGTESAAVADRIGRNEETLLEHDGVRLFDDIANWCGWIFANVIVTEDLDWRGVLEEIPFGELEKLWLPYHGESLQRFADECLGNASLRRKVRMFLPVGETGDLLRSVMPELPDGVSLAFSEDSVAYAESIARGAGLASTEYDARLLPLDAEIAQVNLFPLYADTVDGACKALENGADMAEVPAFFGGVQHNTWKWGHPRIAKSAEEAQAGLSKVFLIKDGWFSQLDQADGGFDPARYAANGVLVLDRRIGAELRAKRRSEMQDVEANAQ